MSIYRLDVEQVTYAGIYSQNLSNFAFLYGNSELYRRSCTSDRRMGVGEIGQVYVIGMVLIKRWVIIRPAPPPKSCINSPFLGALFDVFINIAFYHTITIPHLFSFFNRIFKICKHFENIKSILIKQNTLFKVIQE